MSRPCAERNGRPSSHHRFAEALHKHGTLRSRLVSSETNSVSSNRNVDQSIGGYQERCFPLSLFSAPASRCGCSGFRRWQRLPLYPFGRTIRIILSLPDRHLLLKRVNEKPTRGKALIPMWCGYPHDHTGLRDGNDPGSMQQNETLNGPAAGCPLREGVQLLFGHRPIRVVFQSHSLLLSRVSARDPNEQANGSAGRIAEEGVGMIEVEGTFLDRYLLV